MSEKRVYISRRLEEVLEWKDAINKEVEHLPTEEALKVLMERARAAGDEFRRRYGHVAETEKPRE